ncbi:hypothetical protein [Streptomyces diastatochromogenes]|uniref:hypothetical protein n=1 Tax=Streptomyces diastatochromogenes TaxID=42236 RepID=UPI0036ADD9EB
MVRAQSTVYLAWKLRGAKKAKYTTQEQFQGFHRTLVGAHERNVTSCSVVASRPLRSAIRQAVVRGSGLRPGVRRPSLREGAPARS